MKNAVEITKGIYWTGSLDYNIRVFDVVMYTEYGTTYNAYALVGSEKTALIETAKAKFFDEYIERVKQVCDPAKVDYIIANHTEPDHTGSLIKMIEMNPEVTVVGSMSAIRFLKNIANCDFKSMVVKDGDTIDLGGKTLKFILAPFLHWPDSMYTYCVEDSVLFTCDSFGCHYCSDKIFNDLVDGDFDIAYKYYFDVIMGPFKSYVLQALDKIKNLDLKYVCTGHGPVLRKDIDKMLEKYRVWSTPVKPERPSIAIAYVSSYGYTETLAKAIYEAVSELGKFEVNLFNLIDCDKNKAFEAASSADGILLGSPTLIGNMLPPIWEILGTFNPVIHKGKLAGVFGSYGWSGEAISFTEERFKQLKFALPVPSFKTILKPSDEDITKVKEFAGNFAVEVDKAFNERYNIV